MTMATPRSSMIELAVEIEIDTAELARRRYAGPLGIPLEALRQIAYIKHCCMFDVAMKALMLALQQAITLRPEERSRRRSPFRATFRGRDIFSIPVPRSGCSTARCLKLWRRRAGAG